MAYLLFIDESGHDRQESPYEVLAGVAVEDRDIWNLIQAVHAAELRFFGQRVTHDHGGELELKGKKLLKKKVFKHAAQLPPFAEEQRTPLALECLKEGAAAVREQRPMNVRRNNLVALAQAKLAFVQHLFVQLARFGARAVASIVDVDAPRPTGDFLRKDYSYLLERFFYLLDDRPARTQGLVVFDEIDKSLAHTLVNQMRAYFCDTAVGKQRASHIVPEPLFVHSDLTTLVQLADLVAYVISWGVRVGSMARAARPELASFAREVLHLRHRAVRERNGEPFYVWSFAVIDDLRSRTEREEGETVVPSEEEDGAAA